MLDSIPQPDVFLRIDPSYGWQSRDQGEYPAGAPELIVEVCPTSTEVDFGPELALYIRACVREYGTIELLRKRIAWRRCRQAWTQMSTGCPRHPSQQNASRAGYEKNNILPHRRPTRDARYKMKKSCAGMLSHLRHTYR